MSKTIFCIYNSSTEEYLRLGYNGSFAYAFFAHAKNAAFKSDQCKNREITEIHEISKGSVISRKTLNSIFQAEEDEKEAKLARKMDKEAKKHIEQIKQKEKENESRMTERRELLNKFAQLQTEIEEIKQKLTNF